MIGAATAAVIYGTIYVYILFDFSSVKDNMKKSFSS